MRQLTNVVKTVLCKNSVAAGATDITDATVIDMAGYDGVRFIFGFGVITAGAATSIGVAGKATNTPTPGTDDLTGSKQTVADTADNTVFICEITHPQQRYLRPFVKRATQNAVVDFVLAELYRHNGKNPITQDATVSGTEIFDAPAVGTA
jgi:hypothetical protein